MNWGIIGCGDVVYRKSGKPFDWEEKSKVLAVMCRNLEAAEKYAKERHVPEFYNDAEKIISHKDIDAIYIATPPSTHMPYAKRAIMEGKPVYIEKPLGMNTGECEEMLALAKEKNVPVFVAFYRRALPKFNEIKQLIDDGEIGDVRFVHIKQYIKAGDGAYEWRRDPAISGGGLFHDLACHTLDILDFIISPIETVHGFSANQRKMFESDDIVTTSFQFANGVLGTGVWCSDVAEEEDRVEIIGNKGKLVFSIFESDLTIVRGDSVEEKICERAEFIQEHMIHNVISAINGTEKALSTGESALRTVRVMDRILGI